jgi:hypothetical protein
MDNSLETYLDFTPMTRQQICICCHAVRGCKGCCRTCLGCSGKHECEHEVNPEGMDSVWWNAIVETFSFKHVTDSLPDGLRKTIAKYSTTRKTRR